MRAKKHGVIRHGADSPLHEIKTYTLNEASKLYFEHINHKSNTHNMRGMYSKHFEESKLGGMVINDITPNDLEIFKRTKLAQKSFKTKRPYAPATINRFIDMFSAIINYMHEYHGVKIDNPAKGVDRYKTDNKRIRYLDEDEIQTLLEAIRTSKKLRKKELVELFTLLALTTGARLTSILHITKGDINLNSGHITLKDFKRNDTYRGHIHDSVIPLLEAQMSRIRSIDHVIGGNPKPMQKENINKMLQPLLNELFNEGLDVGDSKRRVVIHTFRHTFASLLAIAGVPIFTIKELMHHKEIDMTMRYAKLAPDQGGSDVKGLNI